MKCRVFDYSEEFVNDLKNNLDIDIKNLIDDYLDNRVSKSKITIGYKVYDINIENNRMKVTVKLIKT